MVEASPEARNRYVVRKRKLLALPTSPPELLTTRLLSNAAKLAVFGEPLVDAGESLLRKAWRRSFAAASIRKWWITSPIRSWRAFSPAIPSSSRFATRFRTCTHSSALRGR